MYQSLFGSILASDLISIVLVIGIGAAFNWWVRPLIKENKELKEIHYGTLDKLPTIDDYEKKFETFKSDLRDIIDRNQASVTSEVRHELSEHIRSLEEILSGELTAIQSMFDGYSSRLEQFTDNVSILHNDMGGTIEKTESHMKASKYQYANILVVLENIIMVNQEFSRFFEDIMNDIEEKELITKVNYEPLKKINKILVSINDEAMKIAIKIKAEEHNFERMIAD